MRPVPQQRSSTARTSAASLLHSSWRWAAQRSWQPSTTISSYTPASREYGSAPFPPVVHRSLGSWPCPLRTPPTLGSPRNVLSPMGADLICSHPDPLCTDHTRSGLATEKRYDGQQGCSG